MPSYEEKRRQLVSLESDARAAIREIKSILNLMAKYKVKKYSGVSIEWSGTSVDKELGVIIPDIKAKIDILERTYTHVFPEEFIYLQVKELRRFRCLPAALLLQSNDFVSALNNTLKAMNEKVYRIELAKQEMNAAASDTQVAQGALAAFTSVGTTRLFDTTSTTEQFLEDTKNFFGAKDGAILDAINKEADDEVTRKSASQGQISPQAKYTKYFGMVMAGVKAIPELMQAANLALLGAQYPKSFQYCNPKREKLNLDSLQRGRETSSSAASELDRISKAKDNAKQRGAGARYAETEPYKALVREYNTKWARLSVKDPIAANVYQKKYKGITESLLISETKDGVKQQVDALKKLIQRLDAS